MPSPPHSLCQTYSEYLSFRSFFSGFPVRPSRARSFVPPRALPDAIRASLANEPPLAILLSSGMDSASLLPFLPNGSVAYTLYNEGAVDKESALAAAYCDKFGVAHKRIAIRQTDYAAAIDPLMLAKRMPLTPAEPTVYLGARAIVADGFDTIVTGAGPDCLLGGFPKLRNKWQAQALVRALHRKYVDPAQVLRAPATIDHVLAPYRRPGGLIDTHAFLREVGVARFAQENAVVFAGARIVAPYAQIDVRFNRLVNRLRPKYVVQDLFQSLYGQTAPPKIGLRKPADWLAGYRPTADIFRDFDIAGMKYPQKFQIYALERFDALYRPS